MQNHARKSLRTRVIRHWQLYAFLLLPVVYFVIFRYIPLSGLQIAFRKYTPRGGIWGSEWVGIKNFLKFFRSHQFERVISNTLRISFYSLIAGFQVLDKRGMEVFGQTNLTSREGGFATRLPAGKSFITYHFTWPEIREGDYFMTLGLGTGREVLCQTEQCWVNQAVHFSNSTSRKLIYGLFNRKMEDFQILAMEDEEKHE